MRRSLPDPGVALQRLGRVEEAVATCDQVGEGSHLDEHILGTLAIVYNAAGKQGSLTRKVEAAVASKPGDLGLQQALFKAYCREFAFAKMQQVAMKLYQGIQEQRYMLWAVVSNLLQVKCGIGQNATAKPEQLLQLAGMMAARCVRPGCNFYDLGRESLLLYLEVLHEQKDLPKALEVFSSFTHGAESAVDTGTDLKEVMCRSEWEMLRAMLHLGAGKSDQALNLLEQFVSTVPGDVAALDSLLDVIFPDTKLDRRMHSSSYLTYNPLDMAAELSAALPSRFEPDAGWSLAERLVASMTGSLAPNRSSARGAALAPLCLILRKHRWCSSQGTVDELSQYSGELARLALGFWKAFGDLKCCFVDLRASLAVLQPTDASWLRGELMEKSRKLVDLAKLEDGADEKEGRKVVQRVVSAYEICHEMSIRGACDPPGTASEVLDIFLTTKHHARGLDERENGPGDGLVAVAISLMLKDVDLGLHARVTQAVAILEGITFLAPYNADVRLCLAALYGYLCAPNLVQEQLSHLEIKNIQMESVTSHVGMPCFALCGSEFMRKSCAALAKFHWNHKHQVGDSLSAAINNGTFIQAVDFAAFTQQLDQSYNRRAALVEDGLCELIDSIMADIGSSVSHVEKIAMCVPQEAGEDQKILDSLRFNSDLQVRADWNVPRNFGSDDILKWWDTESGIAPLPWWKRPRSAESDTPPANEWRAALKKELRCRWNLIRILKESMFIPGTRGTSSSHIPLYLECADLQATPRSMIGCSASAWAGHELCKNLVAWIFISAESVKRALLYLENGECGDSSGLSTTEFKECRQNLEEVSGGVALLIEKCPSAGLPLLALALREPLTWTSILLHNWAKAMQALKKRRKKTLAPQQDDPPFIDLGDTLLGFSQVLAVHTGALQETVKLHADAVKTKTFGTDELPLSPHIEALWQGQSPQRKSNVLQNVQASQSALLTALGRLAEFHHGTCKAFKI